MKKLMMAAMMMAAAFAATADNWGFTYQAALMDEKGTTPLSGQKTVEIRLWKTATGSETANLLWGRLYTVMLDKDGLFNLTVSDDTGSALTSSPLPEKSNTLAEVFTANDAGKVYVGLTVQGSSEIVPRQQILTVPFAGTANAARAITGDATVSGSLNFPNKATITSNGIAFPAGSASQPSTITADKIVVSSISATGTLTVKNIEYSGTLTDSQSRELIAVPVGGIILWSKAELPDTTHWAICDGSTKNGVTTPDLRGRFIVGVGKSSDGATTYGLNAHGGEETHTLSTDEMPTHAHALGGEGLQVDNKDDYIMKCLGWEKGDAGNNPQGTKKTYAYITSNTGGGASHENRPPYFALYYIMRVK